MRIAESLSKNGFHLFHAGNEWNKSGIPLHQVTFRERFEENAAPTKKGILDKSNFF